MRWINYLIICILKKILRISQKSTILTNSTINQLVKRNKKHQFPYLINLNFIPKKIKLIFISNQTLVILEPLQYNLILIYYLQLDLTQTLMIAFLSKPNHIYYRKKIYLMRNVLQLNKKQKLMNNY